MGIKLNCDNIKEEDKSLAISVRNYLASGNRVIGQPGESLKQTLVQLEKELENKEYKITDWQLTDAHLIAKIAMTKAGIKGEEGLCDYLSTLLKYEDKLEGLVAFASLCYKPEENTKDYVPDTDTLLVYGKNVLVVDAKNLKTRQGHPLMLKDGNIVDDKEKPIIHVNSSIHIWKNIFYSAGIQINSIEGYVCIVNDTPTEIIRNNEWEICHNKLIHISELHDILINWIQNKDNKLYLDMLTQIAKTQVKKEKKIDLDIDSIKRQFGV